MRWQGMRNRGEGVIWRRLAKVVSLGAASLISDRGSIATAASGPNGPAGGAGVEGAGPSSSRSSVSPHARDALARAIARREEWRRGREAVLREDFGETAHFRRANAALPTPVPGEKRVVFVGDSITAGWSLDRSFPGKGYLNRGIGGQTTSQVLVRFRQDVIDLAPAAVVILLGTNDIAGNTGPIGLADIQRNIASMAELAHIHHIAVALSSVLPVHGYTPESETSFPLRPPARIVELNRWLAGHAVDHGYAFIDYFAAMVDERGQLKKELAKDGLHPNEAGYAIMTPLAEAVLGKILSAAPARPAGLR
jgi:lysophospholipase L1-like esterase